METVTNFDKLAEGIRFTRNPSLYNKFVVYDSEDYKKTHLISSLIFSFIKRYNDKEQINTKHSVDGRYLMLEHNLNEEQEEELLTYCNFKNNPSKIVEKGILVNKSKYTMNILHISPKSDGYEEVTLLANRINKKNRLAAILKDGEEFFTGGFLINDTPEIRKVLDTIPKGEQYEFVKSFKMNPFAKPYLEEDVA